MTWCPENDGYFEEVRAMKIVSVETALLETPLITPFKTAVRQVDAMADVLVRITDSDGRRGWGSAPPTGKVTGDTIGAILGAVDEHLRPALLGRDGEDLNDCLDAVDNALVGNTSAKAALDIALHDLWAKTLGQPVWKLLGGAGGDIETDVTVSANPPEEMARDAVRAVKRGFKCLKTKVGVGADIDFARLKAIRDAVGSELKIRIDANQGWEPAEAVRVLNRMADAGLDIELVEQPVKARDRKGIAQQLIESGFDKNYPAALISSASMPNEKVIKTDLISIVEKDYDIESPAIIVVGEVVNVLDDVKHIG